MVWVSMMTTHGLVTPFLINNTSFSLPSHFSFFCLTVFFLHSFTLSSFCGHSAWGCPNPSPIKMDYRWNCTVTITRRVLVHLQYFKLTLQEWGSVTLQSLWHKLMLNMIDISIMSLSFMNASVTLLVTDRSRATTNHNLLNITDMAHHALCQCQWMKMCRLKMKKSLKWKNVS